MLDLENKITPLVGAVIDASIAGNLNTKVIGTVRKTADKGLLYADLIVVGMNLISANVNLKRDTGEFENTFVNK